MRDRASWARYPQAAGLGAVVENRLDSPPGEQLTDHLDEGGVETLLILRGSCSALGKIVKRSKREFRTAIDVVIILLFMFWEPAGSSENWPKYTGAAQATGCRRANA